MRRILQTLAAVWLASMLANGSRADEPKRAGALVSLEILMVEFATPAESPAAGQIDLGDDPLARVRELEKEGRVSSSTKFQLSTLENQQASVTIGEQAPVVTGRARVGRLVQPGGGGESPFFNSFNFQNIGSRLQVVPRVESDGSVLVEFDFEKSQLSAPAAVAESGDGPAASGGFSPPSVLTTTVKTTMRIPPGKSVDVGGSTTFETTADSKTFTQVNVLLSAKVTAAPAANQQSQIDPAQTKVFTLANTPAEEIIKVLSLVTKEETRLATDPRTNSIIAHGSEENLDLIESLLLRLDESVKKLNP